MVTSFSLDLRTAASPSMSMMPNMPGMVMQADFVLFVFNKLYHFFNWKEPDQPNVARTLPCSKQTQVYKPSDTVSIL